MPFTPAYRDFEAGDLVYGVHKSAQAGMGRANYLKGRFKGGITIEEYDIIKMESDDNRPADHQSFVAALTGHPKYRDSIDADYTNASVRLKDKGGLYWAVREGKFVNFVLDGIDIPEVVGKSFSGTNADRAATADAPKNRSITGAELRWVYRNRFLNSVQSYIQFWFDYKCVCPPWIEYSEFLQNGDIVTHPGKALWAGYKPKTVALGPTGP